MAKVSWPTEADRPNIDRILDLIDAEFAEGRVVVGPSDTVYGCLAPAEEAGYRAMASAKQRPGPFIHLTVSITRALALSREPDAGLQEALAGVWPGPVSVVLTAADPRRGSSIAVRVPKNSFLQAVLSRHPVLLSASANGPGEAPAVGGDDALGRFPDNLVVDGGPSGSDVPSTLVDASERPVRILRRGMGDPGPLLGLP